MSFVFVVAVVLAFAASVCTALVISVGRAAALDHDPAVELALTRRWPTRGSTRQQRPGVI